MKFTLIILTVLAPFFAHAGGGGGLRPGMQTMRNSQEIVFSLGSKDGFDYFAHGQLDNSNWKIQQLALPTETLKIDSALYKAIKKSQVHNTWIQIKE